MRSSGFVRVALLAVLVCGCPFESGGVVGSDGGAASIGSASTGGSTGTDSASAGSTNSASNADPGTSPPTDDSNTAGAPGETGPSITETTGDASTGVDPSGPLDSGDPSESTGDPPSGSSSDGGNVVEPYYGDCAVDADCAPGTCYTTQVINGPDAAVCLLPCGDGCPPPAGGVAAQPVCTASDDCTLSCTDTPDCPVGMTCYSFDGGAYHRCLWSQG